MSPVVEHETFSEDDGRRRRRGRRHPHRRRGRTAISSARRHAARLRKALASRGKRKHGGRRLLREPGGGKESGGAGHGFCLPTAEAATAELAALTAYMSDGVYDSEDLALTEKCMDLETSEDACIAESKCQFVVDAGGMCFAKSPVNADAANRCESSGIWTASGLSGRKDACVADSLCTWSEWDTMTDEQLNSFDAALGEALAEEQAEVANLYTTLPNSAELSCSAAAVNKTSVFVLAFTEALRKYFVAGV